jgi:alpha-1,3-fucosyltransferase
MEIIKRKSRTALWFVSQCNRNSGRDDLAKKLQKIIDVDIYGECGNLSSPHGPELYNETYKFYLAFENSLCLDYLTEKSFKVMNDFIIPVIYSGVDISRFLPPKSYIDVNSFESVDELGNYLKFLAETPEEYVKYFWWKKYYRVQLSSFDVCEICQKLNEPNLHTKQNVYLNINEWWGTYVDCSLPKKSLNISQP